MQTFAQNNFDIIALGTKGGVDDSNISSYLVSVSGADRYIALDAGTLMHGIKKASENGHFDHLKSDIWETEANILLNHIDAYCITHPHLDHITGMMLAGPFDNHKYIYGSQKTINILVDHVFLSPIWGNFSTEGNENGKWDLVRMNENLWYDIPGNQLKIKYFTLCHSCPNESSAFLIEHNNSFLLYFGDTGADLVENSDKLELIFNEITPMIKRGQLKAIFIESSFSNERNNDELYGHLKPELLGMELEKLAYKISPKSINKALSGIKLFITHIKPDYRKINSSEKLIINEINQLNTYGAETIIIKQSDKYKI